MMADFSTGYWLSWEKQQGSFMPVSLGHIQPFFLLRLRSDKACSHQHAERSSSANIFSLHTHPTTLGPQCLMQENRNSPKPKYPDMLLTLSKFTFSSESLFPHLGPAPSFWSWRKHLCCKALHRHSTTPGESSQLATHRESHASGVYYNWTVPCCAVLW